MGQYPWSGHPRIGTVHKNGDRIFGYSRGHAVDLLKAGTPAVYNLWRSSVTACMSSVRIGDDLDVKVTEIGWLVYRDGKVLGKLTWPIHSRGDTFEGVPLPNIGDGILHVQTLCVSAANSVVNCGGYVTPVYRRHVL